MAGVIAWTKDRDGNALSVARSVSLVATGVNLKATAAKVYGWHFGNSGAAPAYVKLYNKATAPAVGTDTPYLTIMIPTGGSVSLNVAGMEFATGLGWGATTGAADADNTAPAANQVTANLWYV